MATSQGNGYGTQSIDTPVLIRMYFSTAHLLENVAQYDLHLAFGSPQNITLLLIHDTVAGEWGSPPGGGGGTDSLSLGTNCETTAPLFGH